MDVSRVDPEEVLVDAQNVEAGDVSGDIDEVWLTGKDHGNEDKVLVSVRYVISRHFIIWPDIFLECARHYVEATIILLAI